MSENWTSALFPKFGFLWNIFALGWKSSVIYSLVGKIWCLQLERERESSWALGIRDLGCQAQFSCFWSHWTTLSLSFLKSPYLWPWTSHWMSGTLSTQISSSKLGYCSFYCIDWDGKHRFHIPTNLELWVSCWTLVRRGEKLWINGVCKIYVL